MTHEPDPSEWLCLEERTREAWLDMNGHVNVQFYFQLAARGIYELMERTLREGEPPAPPPLFFTLEAHIFYKAELRAGEDVRVFIRPLARTEKTLSVLIRILRAGLKPGEPGVVSAECEWKGAYVDPASRRVAPLSDNAKRIYDAKLEAGRAAEPYVSPNYPKGAELPPPAKELVTLEGAIEPDWIDRMGHMGIEHYQLIFNRATGGYFRAIGFDTEVLRGMGLGAFGMSSKVQYLKEMKAGEPFRATTRMLSLQPKTCTILHELWTAGGAKVRAATCEHTSAFVDWKTRRVIPIPDAFASAIARYSKH